jgi:hypothetical protein
MRLTSVIQNVHLTVCSRTSTCLPQSYAICIICASFFQEPLLNSCKIWNSLFKSRNYILIRLQISLHEARRHHHAGTWYKFPVGAQSVNWVASSGQLWFISLKYWEFLFAITSRPAVDPTQPFINWLRTMFKPVYRFYKSAAGAWRWPLTPHLMPRLCMSRSYISLPPCASMACSGTAFFTIYTSNFVSPNHFLCREIEDIIYDLSLRQ